VSLEEEIKKTLNNFENASSETILEIIDQIRPHFRSELTSEYLSGKSKKSKMNLMMLQKRINVGHYCHILIGICKGSKIALNIVLVYYVLF